MENDTYQTMLDIVKRRLRELPDLRDIARRVWDRDDWNGSASVESLARPWLNLCVEREEVRRWTKPTPAKDEVETMW
jgi:hypothetical protein